MALAEGKLAKIITAAVAQTAGRKPGRDLTPYWTPPANDAEALALFAAGPDRLIVPMAEIAGEQGIDLSALAQALSRAVSPRRRSRTGE